MPPSFDPKPEQKISASPDIQYEWDQLSYCYSVLDSYRDPNNPNLLRKGLTPAETRLYNALITTFTVHTRSLLYFFHHQRQKDDVIALDYFKSGSTWALPVVPKRDEDWRESIEEKGHKLTAHITYTRVAWTDDQRKWPISEIYAYLSVLWADFTSKASPNLWQPTVKG